MASVRRFWRLPPCTTEPMSAGSKMDPVLASSESISDDGNASGITELRRGVKKVCAIEAVVRQKE